MPTTQTLLWVALPSGIGLDGDLRLSVLVTPRLRSDEGQTLALFPDFLDWAARMQPDQASFAVVADDGTTVPAVREGDPPDAALWRTLFHAGIPLRPFVFDDHANRPIVSFPVGAVQGWLKQRYAALAARSPFDLPPVRPREDGHEAELTLEQAFRDLVLLHREPLRAADEAQLSAQLEASLERARDQARARREAGAVGGPVIEPPGIGTPGSPQDAFYRAMLFHHRPRAAEPLDLPDGDAARARFEADIDFHQMLAASSDFPPLLRRLGLVVDLRLPRDALPRSPFELAPRKLRVVPTWTPQLAASVDLSPWTVYRLGTLADLDLFAAASRDGRVEAGLWLPEPSVELTQLDVDGAALKSLNLAASLARTLYGEAPEAIDAPGESGVPALRTSGIGVVRGGHAATLNEALNRSGAINRMLESEPPQLADLHAEDLVQGYRADVREERTADWRSLHRRIGTYAVPASPGIVPELADEGWAQLAVTSPTGGKPELYLHETLLTWDGWSLSAPRPGKAISRSPRAPAEGEPETQPQRMANQAMTTLGLETSFRVEPGTLPRLRFGHGYRLRLRAVDLAGNSPSLGEASERQERVPELDGLLPRGGTLRYLRFEPVAAPELVPRQLYAPDGAAPTAFAEGESLQRLVVRSSFDATAEEYAVRHPAYQPVSERHVAPPKASLQLVETHGLLDAALDAKRNGLDAAAQQAVIHEFYELAKREAGSLDDPSLPSVVFVRTGADPAARDGYAVHTVAQLLLPYLPDPLAAGAVLRGLPGQLPDEAVRVGFDGPAWHSMLPFRLRLVEGEAAPAWDAAERVMTVSLPKAGVVKVRLSSAFGGEVEHMGLWSWLMEAADRGEIPGERMDELYRGIAEGRHWMVTPFRELTLVHAVQKPLEQPDPRIEPIQRGTGTSGAHLRGEVHLHAPSTAKLDLLAAWSEPRDDPAREAPDRIDAEAHVAELTTWLDGQPVRVSGLESDEALRVEDEKVLIFNTEHAWRLRLHLEGQLAGAGLDARDRRLQDQVNLLSKVTPHALGDTKYRRVTYKVRATSRFREYFAPALAGDLHRDSQPFALDILSSARPAPPRLLYVLPTFGWEQVDDGTGTVTSRRKGGSLRVYLDRPWWSSGEGELLAVVLHQHLPDRSDPRYGRSTFWGQDPVWRSPALPLPLPPAFKNSVGVFGRVPDLDLPGALATVVGFPVTWDGERRLWYADLELETGNAYFPFIRLALARYQPNAPETLRLSPVILADLVQTAPDRTTVMVREEGSVRVAVSGVAGTSAVGANRVEAVVQARQPDLADDALGWRDVGDPVALAPGAPDADGITVWEGVVSLPQAAAPLRLLVQELELLPPARPVGPDALARRLVHADILPL